MPYQKETRKATARVPTLPNICPRLYYDYGVNLDRS